MIAAQKRRTVSCSTAAAACLRGFDKQSGGEQFTLAAFHGTFFSVLSTTKGGVQMNASKLAVCVQVFLGIFAASVNAQCRIGSGPDHHDGLPYCSQLTPPTKKLPAPQWAVQWGAIAYGGGGFGAAKQMNSVSEAKNAALRACRDSGGSDHCKVGLSYSDQCVAYAIGDDYSVGVARSPMPEEAHSLAMDSCAGSTTNCKVTYAACSLPVRIR
jgi:hypothetical protein